MDLPSKQELLDLWSSLPDKLRPYVDPLADSINVNVDTLSTTVRETLSTATWLPEAIRPSPLPPPPLPTPTPVLPESLHGRVYAWVMRNKVLTGIMVVAAGTLVYRGYRRAQLGKKVRRARRAGTGARMEVVIIAGSPLLPLTRCLALYMERKGFIVYVVCGGLEEENTLRDMARADIQPLSLDIKEPVSSGAAIERFAQYLQTPHQPAPRTKPNNLVLKSILLIPSLDYQASPIATIPPSSFADLFNSHLLSPILTVQAFLPLLTARLSPDEKWEPAKVLVFTPSMLSSISPPFHAPEATVCSALTAFTEVLAAELRPLGIPVTHMQLGAFDFSYFMPHVGPNSAFRPRPKMLRVNANDQADETVGWPEHAKHTYGRNFNAQANGIMSIGRTLGLRGSRLSHLNDSVFDVIDGSITGESVRVGLGASMCGFVGRWTPKPLLGYVLGMRKVDELAKWKNPTETRPLTGSDDGMHASKEFVAIPHDVELGGSGVWRH